MTTHIDKLLFFLFHLPSKCTHDNLPATLLLLVVVFLLVSFYHWSHPGVAKEILKLFNRAMGFVPYGVYCRTLGRIATNHLISRRQIISSEFCRSEIADHSVELFDSLFHWFYPGGPAWGKYYYWKRKTTPAIPGPRGFPLLGSIHLMSSSLAHRGIAAAAAASACNARRLMAYSLGNTRVIVSCHPDVAKEILNSAVFADRPIKESAYSLMFNRAVGFAPYGAYWRTLRRIATNHLFSHKQIKASESCRSEIAAQMVALFGNENNYYTGFPVRHVLKKASLSHMMSSVFGKYYRVDESNREMEELRGLVEEGYDLLGTLNWGDHLPWLLDFDAQEIQFRCSTLVPKVNRFVSEILADHRAHDEKDQTNRDFVDVLLSLHGPDQLSDSDMIAVLWEMIFRGTDTVAILVEWILARMVVHSDVQCNVQEELDQVVGKSRAVTKADVDAMVYLPAVVKEVLRLHPPGPLLSGARLAIADTTIDGYHVPKGTTAMVNMWAIARDPDVWVDPLKFTPERFLSGEGEGEFSIFGSDLRLSPFGSGSRMCPGKSLGFATVTFWVASLLHEFQWLPSDEADVDLSEVLRLSSEMAHPLMVKVCPRRGGSA